MLRTTATAVLIALFLDTTAECSAFISPAQTHRSVAKSIGCKKRNGHVPLPWAWAEKARGVDFGSVLSSLPSPDDVKENILEGNAGERGELYVIAQFSLFLFIAIGSVPLVGDALFSVLGPALILAGLALVYKSAADLDNNLSPWPVPTQSKRGSLVDEGIYSYIRHPMYAGSLLGMMGLSLVTDSVSRLLLTLALYLVLDAKSDFEESKLIESYGSKYEDYKEKVPGKFIPADVNDIFPFLPM